MKSKKTQGKKPNRRAEGKTQTSISLEESVLEAAKEIAAKDERSLSKWLELLIKEKLHDLDNENK